MRIGILTAPGLDWEPIYEFLTAEVTVRSKEHIRLVTCDELSIYDLLVIPDCNGYDLTSEAFFPHHSIPMDYVGPNQFVSRFGIYSLPYYIRKGIKILGFGHSAFLLWDKGLQNKLTFSTGELELLHAGQPEAGITMYPENDSNTIFKSPNMWGVKRFVRKPEFYSQLMRFINQVNAGNHGNDTPPITEELEYVPT